MTESNNTYKPIIIFGYIISVLGVLQLALIPAMISRIPTDLYATMKWPIVPGIILLLTYVVGGIGIVMRRMWGYYLLILILYSIILFIPIGTIVSYKLFKYIKTNNIKIYFGKRYIEE